MDEKGIKQFFSDRVPLSGRLSDYALLVGQNNRVLQSIIGPQITGSSTFIPPRPNRVALCCNAFSTVNVQNQEATLELLSPTGAIIWRWQIYNKILTLSGLEVAVLISNPLIMTVLDFGPMVQQSFRVSITGNFLTVTYSETIMTPICCEYVGGIK